MLIGGTIASGNIPQCDALISSSRHATELVDVGAPALRERVRRALQIQIDHLERDRRLAPVIDDRLKDARLQPVMIGVVVLFAEQDVVRVDRRFFDPVRRNERVRFFVPRLSDEAIVRVQRRRENVRLRRRATCDAHETEQPCILPCHEPSTVLVDHHVCCMQGRTEDERRRLGQRLRSSAPDDRRERRAERVGQRRAPRATHRLPDGIERFWHVRKALRRER
jgi:hypothetical protein